MRAIALAMLFYAMAYIDVHECACSDKADESWRKATLWVGIASLVCIVGGW